MLFRHDIPKNPKLKIVFPTGEPNPMSIIVVEGPDGSGKTTLIDKARGNQKDRYFIVCRASRYQPTIQDAFQYLAWIRYQKTIDVILDRFHFISDRVYGPILRNEDVFKALPLDFGLQQVSTVIYARPPLDTILANVTNGSNQLEGVSEKTARIVQEYDLIMAKLKGKGVNIHRYDYTTDDATAFWRFIWSDLREEKK